MPKVALATNNEEAKSPTLVTSNVEKKLVEEKTLEPMESLASVDMNSLKDGVYIGQGKGYNGIIKVQVTVLDKKIARIDILSDGGDDPPYFSMARVIVDKVVATQSLNVDSVSGATFSSRGLIKAIMEALSQSSGKTLEEPKFQVDSGSNTVAQVVTPITVTEGAKVFVGKGQGYRYITGLKEGFSQEELDKAWVNVAIGVKDRDLEQIQITSHSEDKAYFKIADPFIITQIMKDKSIVNCKNSIASKDGEIYDNISGATMSSKAIVDGIEKAVKEAITSGSLDNGFFGVIVDGMPVGKPDKPVLPKPDPDTPTPTPTPEPEPIKPPTPTPEPVKPPTPEPVKPKVFYGYGKGYKYEEAETTGAIGELLDKNLVKVEVTVEDGKIQSVKVISHLEDRVYMRAVNPYLPRKIVETQQLFQINKEIQEKNGPIYDEISGSTKSAKAITQGTIDAVKEGIKAGALPDGYGGVFLE